MLLVQPGLQLENVVESLNLVQINVDRVVDAVAAGAAHFNAEADRRLGRPPVYLNPLRR